MAGNKPICFIVKLINKTALAFMVFLIRLYQLCISPYLPVSCRFVPTCSEYSRQALLMYGPVRGLWLTVKRILRCHPFAKGGYDPVPLDREH